jgi:starch-binding outer membrane protein, SusD/RagB family
MKRYKLILTPIAISLLMMVTSCLKDVTPIDPNITSSATVYNDPAAFKEGLAKVYAIFAVSGQKGPAGDADISGIDEGFSNYLRQYWIAQELTTDEAIVAWNDVGLPDEHYQSWGSSNSFVTAMYNRIYYMISIANEYIRTVTPKIGSDADITHYVAEARFLRALAYWHGLDMYGSIPFVTEKDKVGLFFPKQISKADLFTYIESELKAISPLLAAPKANEYARADRAAAWSVLAKLYLNAPVYINTDKNSDCLTYCDSIIKSGYSLNPVYQNLFLADNDQNNPEVIFPIAFDGLHTQTYGGTTFIVHSAVGGSMSPATFGLDYAWGGHRVTKDFVAKFSDISGATDKRAMFYTTGQSLEINAVGTFTDGYAITKYKNMKSTGTTGSNSTFVDNDFPLFRLADFYLVYAEAALRSNTNLTTALNYVNLVRERAYGNNSGDITSGQLTLSFILDERARELYWEGSRRTDLIRYNYFTGGSYLWAWKGGVKAGGATDAHYNVFPIPSSDMGANPNLKQNDGY